MKQTLTRLFIGSLLSCIFLFFTLPAAAENRIVILSAPSDTTAGRLLKELETAGFAAEIIADPGGDLETIARQKNAAAAIRASLVGRTVQVWVADRVTGKVVMRSIAVEPGDEPMSSVVVIAAVELLRASFMEIHAQKKPEGEVAPPAVAASFSKPPERPTYDRTHINTAFGPGFTFLGADLGMSANLAAQLGVMLFGKLSINLVGVFPLSKHRVEEPEGTAFVLPFLTGGDVTLSALAPDYRIRPLFGVGMGALILKTRGELSDDLAPSQEAVLDSHEDTTVSPTPWLRAGITARMAKIVSMRLDLLAGYSLVQNRLEIAGRYMASPGRPWISVNLMLELTLW